MVEEGGGHHDRAQEGRYPFGARSATRPIGMLGATIQYSKQRSESLLQRSSFFSLPELSRKYASHDDQKLELSVDFIQRPSMR